MCVVCARARKTVARFKTERVASIGLDELDYLDEVGLY